MSKRISKMEWKPYLPLRGRSQRVPTKRDFTFTKTRPGDQNAGGELIKATKTVEGRLKSIKTASQPHKERYLPEDPGNPKYNIITSPLARIIPTVVGDTEEEEDMDVESGDEEEVVPESQQDLVTGSITEAAAIVDNVVFDIRDGQIRQRLVETQVIHKDTGDEEPDVNLGTEDKEREEKLRYEPEMDIEGHEDMAETAFDEHIEAGHFARLQKSSNLSTVSHAPSFRLQRHSTPIPKSRRPPAQQTATQYMQDLASPPSTKKKSLHTPVQSPRPSVVTHGVSGQTEGASQQTTAPSPARSRSQQTTAPSPARSRSQRTTAPSPARSRSQRTTAPSPARSRSQRTTAPSPARSRSQRTTAPSPARSQSTSEVKTLSKQPSHHPGLQRSSPRSGTPATTMRVTDCPAATSSETSTVRGNTSMGTTLGKSHHKPSHRQSHTGILDSVVPTPTTTHKMRPVENRRPLFSDHMASPPTTTKGTKPANKAQATLDSFLCVTPSGDIAGVGAAGPKAQRKRRTVPAAEVDENMPTDVRVWQGGASPRSLSHLTDLDVILDRLEEAAWDVKDQTDDRVKRKAINRLMVKTQNDIQLAIADSHAVVKLKTSVSKSGGTVRRKRKELLELQSKTASVKADVIDLKKQQKLQQKLQSPPHHNQKVMQDMSEFLFKLSSLAKKARKSAPTDFVIIGSTTETEVLSESSSVRRRLDLRDGQDM